MIALRYDGRKQRKQIHSVCHPSVSKDVGKESRCSWGLKSWWRVEIENGDGI